MTLRPAAYRLAQRKAALQDLQARLDESLAADLPLDEKLDAQFFALDAIFHDGMAWPDRAGLLRVLQANAQALRVWKQQGKICRKQKSGGTD